MSRPVAPRVAVWGTTLLWAATALGLWGAFDHQLKNGTEIALKAVPVDPRDVLRGDYVVLRYEVSSAPREREGANWYWGEGQTVFVSIAEDGDGEWRIRDVGRQPPAEGLFLRGRMRSAGTSRLDIQYGIESFFVPEGEGRKYEEARNRDRLWAVVSVSPHGTAHLKRLEIR